MLRAECRKEWDEISDRAAVALESVPQAEALAMLQLLGELIARKRRRIREAAQAYAATFHEEVASAN